MTDLYHEMEHAPVGNLDDATIQRRALDELSETLVRAATEPVPDVAAPVELTGRAFRSPSLARPQSYVGDTNWDWGSPGW